jgi:hypothetical protein
MNIIPIMAIFVLTNGQVDIHKWSPGNLNKELIPIAHLESSSGINTIHKPSRFGEFDTAYGALGLKAATAYDMYKMAPRLQLKWPGLTVAEFLFEFITDRDLYDACANVHWNYLRQNTDSLIRAVYAWRYGFTAALAASISTIENELYVSRYLNGSQK